MIRTLYLLSFILLGVSTVFGQAKKDGDQSPTNYRPKDVLSVGQFFEAFAETYNLPVATSWEHKVTTGGLAGHLAHHRYAQKMNGIPVEGATYILHEREGKVERSTGKIYRDSAPSNVPAVSVEDAKAKVSKLVRQGKVANRPSRSFSFVEEPQLVYVDVKYPLHTGKLRLAHAITIAFDRPYDKRKIFIDAHRNAFLSEVPLLAHVTVPGSGMTTYYGEQQFEVDSVSEQTFRLHDEQRNITVRSSVEGDEITSSTSHFDLSDRENGSMAVDVYYGTSRFYDFMNERFGWVGVDGLGEEFIADVVDEANDNFVNAFWNGTNATFGSGDCHFTPLTTLDVVAHEFQHGITERTSSLIYSNESGALNEGLSDIFGKALELHEQPGQFNWILGNRFADSEYARPFRSMENPLLYDKPKTYKGDRWFDGAGVHTNSGPLGHWFYLLVEGGSGTNELGTSYDVSPLGLDDAIRIAFEMNRDYLTESSGYTEAYQGSLLVAEDLFGASSSQYQNLVQAWAAIGLPSSDPGGGGGGNGGFDLRLLGAGSDDTRCHPTDSVVLIYFFNNIGDPIPANTPITLGAEYDGVRGERVITFDTEIPTGAYEYNSYAVPLSLAANTYEDIAIDIKIEDDVDPSNDGAFVSAIVVNTPTDLYVDDVTNSNFSCDQGDKQIFVNVASQGCNQFQDDILVKVLDVNGNTLFSTVAFVELTQFNGYSVEIQLPFEDALRAVEVEISAPNDSNLDNDNIAFVPDVSEYLQPNQILDFEQPMSPVRIMGDENDRGLLGVIPYQNDQVFATTGGTYFGSRQPCLDPEENLFDRFSVPPMLCVDAQELADPELFFDLTQLYGPPNTEFPELNALARAIRVSWGINGDEGRILLPNQADGETNRVSVPLPSNFQGQVFFEIYNDQGSTFRYENDQDLENNDYTLLDNLSVERASSVLEQSPTSYIAPNPADERIMYAPEGRQRNDIQVFNTLGSLVYGANAVGQHVIPTSAWPAGTYVLVATHDGLVVDRFKLVVQH